VAAFVRAGKPSGVLSGVYAFHVEQACNMIRPGDRILDLGCGPALLLTAIAVLNRDSSFLGIDLSDAMIEKGNKSVRDLAVSNVE